MLCPVVVAMGGRDAHDGPAVVSPGVARGVAHGKLERCVQVCECARICFARMHKAA